jgi:hypothetical protein
MLAATMIMNDWKVEVTSTLATISNEFIKFISRLSDKNPSTDMTSFLAV